MPIFTEEEYKDFDARPLFEEAWCRLPVLARWNGLAVCWVGPLVELGHAGWIEEIDGSAYGGSEWSGWERSLRDAGPMRGPVAGCGLRGGPEPRGGAR